MTAPRPLKIAVMALGGLVTAKSIRVAGDEMDQAIKDHMRLTYNLLIGDQTAERIKIMIGSAFPLKLFIPIGAMPRCVRTGSTSCSKLR